MLRAEYDLTSNVTAFAAVGARDNSFKVLATQPTILDSAGTLDTSNYIFPAVINTQTAQAGVRASFDTGFIHHAATVAGSWYDQTNGSSIYFNNGNGNTNLYNPNWGAAPTFPGYSDATPRTALTTFTGVSVR